MSATIPLLSTKGYQTLWNVSTTNHQAFYEDQSPETIRALMEAQLFTVGEEPEALWDGEITLEADVAILNQTEDQGNTTDARNAPILKAALPHITSSRAADHRLWASVNCFALLPYTTRRWNQNSSINAPCRTKDTKRLKEWVQLHFLGHGSEMKKYNAAARLWWLSEMAERAGQHSSYTAERLLPAMANQVEMYHQLLDRPYLASNPRIVAGIYDLALAGHDYILNRPYPNRMLQTLNIKAAAVSMGTLPDNTLRAAIEEAKPPKELRDTA